MTQNMRWIIATVLWTVSVGLMVARSFDAQDTYLGDWSLLVAFGAMTATLIAVVVRERIRTETIATAVCHYSDALEAEQEERENVRRLR